MVSLVLNGIAPSQDIIELLRVFFPKDEIIIIDCIDDYVQGYLIKLVLKENIGLAYIYKDSSLLGEQSEDFTNININRSKEKAIRIGIKKVLYNALIEITDSVVPWGILTGIRPGKIVHDLIEKNTNKETIYKILTQEYKLHSEKANLIIDIAYMQNKYIYPLDDDKYSLYVSIPFCPTRCVYCSFPSLPISRYKEVVDTYVDRLIYEINSISEIMKDKIINTVYIGGGTPTSIPVKSLEKIIKNINNTFKDIKEFTVEAGRPDTINFDVLKMLKDNNVNRISINPQTMNDETLKIIGRKHTSKDIINAFNMAKEIGIKSINMDLIIGLPGEGIKEIKNTLRKLEMLDPDNLTVHTLSVKRGSDFKEHMDEFSIESQTVLEQMLHETQSYSKNMDLIPYYLYRQKQILGNFENIGYAKDGYECIYNIAIMEEKETIMAAGVGAVTKIYTTTDNKIERIPNFKDLKEYLIRTDELVAKKRNYFLNGVIK